MRERNYKYEPFQSSMMQTSSLLSYCTNSTGNHAYLLIPNSVQVVLKSPTNPPVFYNGFRSSGAERLQRASAAATAQPRPIHFQPRAHDRSNSWTSSYGAASRKQSPPYHHCRPSGSLPVSCSVLLVTNFLPPAAIDPTRHNRRAVFLCIQQQTEFRKIQYNTLLLDNDTGA